MLVTVICLTVTMISTSYSIFFDVKTNQNEQTITSGSLTVQFTEGSSSITGVSIYPEEDDEGLTSTSQSVYYIQNSGTTKANVTFTVTESSNHDSIASDYIKLGIFEYDASSGESTLISDIITLSDCFVNSDGDLVLFSSILNSNASSTYSIKFWLSEYSPESIVGSVIDLELNIESEVLEAVMLYDISGTLSNESGVLNNATISLNNGSITSTTSSDGSYNLYDVRSGEYTVTITLEDGTIIKDSLIIGENLSESVSYDSSNNIYTIYGALDESIDINFTVSSNGFTLVEVN